MMIWLPSICWCHLPSYCWSFVSNLDLGYHMMHSEKMFNMRIANRIHRSVSILVCFWGGCCDRLPSSSLPLVCLSSPTHAYTVRSYLLLCPSEVRTQYPIPHTSSLSICVWLHILQSITLTFLVWSHHFKHTISPILPYFLSLCFS